MPTTSPETKTNASLISAPGTSNLQSNRVVHRVRHPPDSLPHRCSACGHTDPAAMASPLVAASSPRVLDPQKKAHFNLQLSDRITKPKSSSGDYASVKCMNFGWLPPHYADAQFQSTTNPSRRRRAGPRPLASRAATNTPSRCPTKTKTLPTQAHIRFEGRERKARNLTSLSSTPQNRPRPSSRSPQPTPSTSNPRPPNPPPPNFQSNTPRSNPLRTTIRKMVPRTSSTKMAKALPHPTQSPTPRIPTTSATSSPTPPAARPQTYTAR